MKNNNVDSIGHTVPPVFDIKEGQEDVFVVEDDPSMRCAIRNLLRSAGFQPLLFASALEFLRAYKPHSPSCLICDIRMPGLSGLDLQTELSNAGLIIPIIFVTGHADDATLSRAMKAGAVRCLTKPFSDQDLLDAIDVSLRLNKIQREDHVYRT